MSGPNDESVSNESVSRSESGGGGASTRPLVGTKKRTETYAIRASSSFPKSARCNGTRTLSPRAARSEHNACSKETAPRATHFVAHALLVFFPNACDVKVSSAPYASTNSASPGAARRRKSRRRAKTCAPREDSESSPRDVASLQSVCVFARTPSSSTRSLCDTTRVRTEYESSLRAASVRARAPLSRPSALTTRAARHKHGSSNPTACSSTSTSEASGSHAPSSPRRNADAAAAASRAAAASPRA